MQIVFDSNVVISALIIENSLAYKVYRKTVEEHILLISHEIRLELTSTIRKRKFDRYFESEMIRNELLLAYLITCKTIIINCSIHACCDPDDNKFLELAVSAKADFIVSGDQDLLVLHPFRNIPMITPTEFLERYI